jgi:hypothetical protein
MHHQFLVAFFVFIVSALWFGASASRQHSAEGEAEAGRVFLLGRLAGPQYFTARGWRHRNISLVCQALAFASMLGWVLTAPGR